MNGSIRFGVALLLVGCGSGRTSGDEVADEHDTTSAGSDTSSGGTEVGESDATSSTDTSSDTTPADTSSDTSSSQDESSESGGSICGDGVVQDGEACDAAGESATCDADCTPAECGDGQVNATALELCDDANAVEDDGCNTLCTTVKCPLQATTWYFGNHAGLSFLADEPVAIEGPMVALEGSAVISDCNGEVVLSSNGNTVYDATGTPMPNGDGDLLGGSSATQAALLFAEPGSDWSRYYLFTVQEGEVGGAPLHYSVIDMSLQGGLGDVVPELKNVPLSPEFIVFEHVVGVPHGNGVDVWVITGNSLTFHAYLVTAEGVSTEPIVSEVGGGLGWWMGQLSASPDGSRLALAEYYAAVEIFDFDDETGELSNPMQIDVPGHPFGAALSPNGQVLYVALYPWGELFQLDLAQPNADAIEASAVQWPSRVYGGELQRGPDGMIYYCNWVADALSRIHQPDEIGLAAEFAVHEIPLLPGTHCYHGLPSLVPGIH